MSANDPEVKTRTFDVSPNPLAIHMLGERLLMQGLHVSFRTGQPNQEQSVRATADILLGLEFMLEAALAQGEIALEAFRESLHQASETATSRRDALLAEAEDADEAP